MQSQLPAESRLELALEIRQQQARDVAWLRQIPAARPNRLQRAVGVMLVKIGQPLARDPRPEPRRHDATRSAVAPDVALAFRERPQHGLW